MSGVRQQQYRQSLRSKTEERAGTILLVASQGILLFLLCAMPLLWGGRSPFAWGMAGLILLFAFSCTLWGHFLRGRFNVESCYGVTFLLVMLAWGALQNSVSFSAFVAPPISHELWGTLSTALGAPFGIRIALTPTYHSQYLFIFAEVALLYMLLCQGFATKRGVVLLALAVLCIVAFYAVFGIAHYINRESFFFSLYTGKVSSVSASFPNKNHFAFMQEMGFFVGLGLLTALIERGKLSSIGQIFGKTFRFALITISVCTVFCFVGIALSYSRAGIFCSLGGLFLFGGYLGICRKRGKASLYLVLILAVALLLLSYYGLNSLLDRLDFALSGEDTSGLVRVEIWKSAWRIIQESPYLGIGFGAFRFLSSMFGRPYGTDAIPYNVHNDFIELAVCLGIPCALFLLCFAAYHFIQTARTLMRSPQSSWHYLGMGALCAIIVNLGHELFDYGLKQPANIFLFCAVILIAGHCAALLRKQTASTAQHKWYVKRKAYFVPILASLLALYCAQPYFSYAQGGYSLERGRVLQKVPEIIRTMPEAARQKAIILQAQSALTACPYLSEALEASVVARYADIRLRLSALYAQKMSAYLGRTISADRVWQEQHRATRIAISAHFTQEERASFAQMYEKAAQEYYALLEIAPADAVSLAAFAVTLYNKNFWENNGVEENLRALELLEQARTLYPHQASVSRMAIALYERALEQNNFSPAQRQEIAQHFWAAVHNILAASPRDIRKLLPVAWFVGRDAAFLQHLVPNTIYGQESLYLFWQEQKNWNEAQKALFRMYATNAVRPDNPDEENPQTMGNFAYIHREKRSKVAISLLIAQYFEKIHAALGNEKALYDTQNAVKKMQYQLNLPEIIRIDALLAQGQYWLAEEKIKRLGDNPSALLRYATILYDASRMELLARVIEKIENQREFLSTKELTQYQRLKEAL